MARKEKQRLVYGMVMDFKNVIELVIENNPTVRELVASRSFMDWHLKLFGYGLTMARDATGIPDIGHSFVWIGSGLVAPFWTLPTRFWPENITKADEELLEKFKIFLRGKNLKFSFLYAHSPEEPEEMKKIVPPAHIEKVALVHVIEAFHKPKEKLCSESHQS